MPQIYFNQTDSGFLELWQTDEDIGLLKSEAVRQRIVFPRGWESWKNEVKQGQALRARIICMEQLQEAEIWYEQNGKPFLPCGRLSISHSSSFLAVAFDRTREIGVDVEEPHERIHKIARRFLHPEEQKNNPGTNELTAIWTIKEAIFKKFGGQTAFYAENIIAEPIRLSSGLSEVFAEVKTETGVLRQKLQLHCSDPYILAFTIS